MRSPAEVLPSSFGRSTDLLDQVDYRLAQTHEEKEAIYNLRYRAYLREGAVKKSPDQRVTDRYDDLPNSWTFGVYLFDELYSSVRISVLTSEWRQSSSTEAFGEILFPLLDQGRVIVDPARFVADPDKTRSLPELPYLTLRLSYMACEHFGADLGLAIVRAEHQAFYRRTFLHETIAEPRMFAGLLKPVGLMAADFPRLKEKVFNRYPMMRSTAFERRMLFTRPAFQPVDSSENLVEEREAAHPDITFMSGPLASLGVGLRESLRNGPVLELCQKIIEHMTQTKAHRKSSLSFSSLCRVVGKKNVDADLLQALTILTTSEQAPLVARAKFIDADGSEHDIAPDVLSATLYSGKFAHPKRDEPIHDFEKNLALYFVPSSSLRAVLSDAKNAEILFEAHQ